MDDLLDAVRGGATGTVADFSNWKGVKEGDFTHMKINSSEKVIEPVEDGEFDEQVVVPEVEQSKPDSQKDIELPKPQERQNMKQDEPTLEYDRPGATQQAYLNPAELKSIAVKLMPSVDKLMHNIYEPLSRDAMRNVSEAAINMAFEFLQVWNEKVSVE